MRRANGPPTHRLGERTSRPALAAVAVAAMATALVVRASLRWGATDAEVARGMAGDELLPQATLVTTHAISVAAPPDQVWPWLVQMGFGRAGWYSLDLLDNGGRPSARRIHPEWQDLAVGDRLPVMPSDPTGERAGFDVVHLSAPSTLVMRTGGRDWTFVWSWEVRPTDDTSRLVVRTRFDLDVPVARLLAAMVFAPGHLVMQRRQLLGIRERATG